MPNDSQFAWQSNCSLMNNLRWRKSAQDYEWRQSMAKMESMKNTHRTPAIVLLTVIDTLKTILGKFA